MFAILAASTILLGSCATGPRPTLGPATSLAPVTDAAIVGVIDALSGDPSGPFTVTYDITTKYGGITSAAEVSFDPIRGTAVLIEDVLYLFPADSGSLTCRWSEETLTAGRCEPGTDETRVSNLQLNSRVFKEAAIDRLVRDSQVAAGVATSRTDVLAERDATCVDVPVIDGAGAQQNKSYCAYVDLGILAFLDTGDLTVKAVFVDDVATGTLFDAATASS